MFTPARVSGTLSGNGRGYSKRRCVASNSSWSAGQRLRSASSGRKGLPKGINGRASFPLPLRWVPGDVTTPRGRTTPTDRNEQRTKKFFDVKKSVGAPSASSSLSRVPPEHATKHLDENLFLFLRGSLLCFIRIPRQLLPSRRIRLLFQIQI